MNFLRLFLTLTVTVYLNGCQDAATEQNTPKQNLPTIQFINNDWVYDGEIVKGHRNLAKVIGSHPVFHVIAPSDMKCSHLSKLWHKLDSPRVKLRLSVTSSSESVPQPSLNIINIALAQPLEIEPVSVVLREKGLFINTEQVTTEKFREYTDQFTKLASSISVIPKASIFFEDKVTYGRLVKLLDNNEDITFEITIIHVGNAPKADHTIKKKTASPKSSSQLLLHRENEDHPKESPIH